jgi:LacI family transcriptional regulator
MAADRVARTLPRRGVTLRDVARAAGVHPSTVSRSLDPERAALVNPATRARVQEVARELDYEPDLVAKGLRNQRTHTIGIVVPDLGNPIYAQLVRGVNDALEGRGYASLVSETTDDSGRLDRTFSLFSRRRADAVITASARTSQATELRRIIRTGLPLVMAIRWIRGVPAPIVANDDRRGGTLAAEHLIELGHTRVAQLHGPSDIETFVQRGLGFRDTAMTAGLDPPASLGPADDPTVAEGDRLMSELLASDGPRPTAVFAHNDLMAIGAIAALRRAGLACPEDISVVGYNDSPIVEYLDPPLSTIRMPLTEIGRVAAETALALVDRGAASAITPVSIALEPMLVPRESTRRIG